MREYPATQPADDVPRRWFADETFELIVWFDEHGRIFGFQLCYNRTRLERALTWTAKGGYAHNRVDDGEASPVRNRTPILLTQEEVAECTGLERFRAACTDIDPLISDFVEERVQAYCDRHY